VPAFSGVKQGPGRRHLGHMPPVASTVSRPARPQVQLVSSDRLLTGRQCPGSSLRCEMLLRPRWPIVANDLPNSDCELLWIFACYVGLHTGAAASILSFSFRLSGMSMSSARSLLAISVLSRGIKAVATPSSGALINTCRAKSFRFG